MLKRIFAFCFILLSVTAVRVFAATENHPPASPYQYRLQSGQQVTLNTYQGMVTVSCNAGGYNPNPPYPHPPYPGQDANYYLRMSDAQLFRYLTTTGVGSCAVSTRCATCACDFYVKSMGQGYPFGTTGCADTPHEAVSLARDAISRGYCL